MKVVHTNRSFWQIHNFPYIKAVELTDDELSRLSFDLTRTDLIEWLVWNDCNGIYGDENSLREFGQVITRDEALEIFIRQVIENRPLM